MWLWYPEGAAVTNLACATLPAATPWVASAQRLNQFQNVSVRVTEEGAAHGWSFVI